MIKSYLWGILIGFDQLANAFLGGDPDETISSRFGKARDNCRFCRFACKVLNVLDWRDIDHCEHAIEPDEGDDETWGI